MVLVGNLLSEMEEVLQASLLVLRDAKPFLATLIGTARLNGGF